MASGLDDYLAFVREGLQVQREFKPKPWYDREFDVLYFYGKDVPSYAHRISPLLTLVLSQADDSLVGIKIKGIRRMLAKFGAAVEHVDGQVREFISNKNTIKLGLLIHLAAIAPIECQESQALAAPIEETAAKEFGAVEIACEELALANC